jgi:hypothetical protein
MNWNKLSLNFSASSSSGIIRRSRRDPLPEPGLITNLFPIEANPNRNIPKFVNNAGSVINPLRFNPCEFDS